MEYPTKGGRHRLRPILMTALATMLALVPLAVTGGGGGAGGAFISAPLAIVVIGGLFTSTLLTLVLVPVLYSLASRFTRPRSTQDLDALLDSADDRRFRPIGLRGQKAAAAMADAGEMFGVNLLLAPEPGHTGDRAVPEALATEGLVVEPVAGTASMRIRVPKVQAPSVREAQQKAVDLIRS